MIDRFRVVFIKSRGGLLHVNSIELGSSPHGIIRGASGGGDRISFGWINLVLSIWLIVLTVYLILTSEIKFCKISSFIEIIRLPGCCSAFLPHLSNFPIATETLTVGIVNILLIKVHTSLSKWGFWLMEMSCIANLSQVCDHWKLPINLLLWTRPQVNLIDSSILIHGRELFWSVVHNPLIREINQIWWIRSILIFTEVVFEIRKTACHPRVWDVLKISQSKIHNFWGRNHGYYRDRWDSLNVWIGRDGNRTLWASEDLNLFGRWVLWNSQNGIFLARNPMRICIHKKYFLCWASFRNHGWVSTKFKMLGGCCASENTFSWFRLRGL